MTSERSQLSTLRGQASSQVTARGSWIVCHDMHGSEQHAETSDHQHQHRFQEKNFRFIATVYAGCCQLQMIYSWQQIAEYFDSE